MASHRRPKQPSRTRVTVLTATAAAAVALSSQVAQADPQQSKKDVKSEVDKLYEQAEQATEKYNGVKEQQDKLQKEVDDLQDKVARGQGELNKLRKGLGSVASGQYRSGSIDPSVQLFLSGDPDTYLEKAATLDQLSGKQAEQLKTIADKQRRSSPRSARRPRARSRTSPRPVRRSARRRTRSRASSPRRSSCSNTLTAKERAAMEAAENRADRSNERVNLGDDVPASQRGAAALSAAQSKIGSPYVWVATGPSSFDCSGLTSWAYQQAGQSLPRTSQAQANAGTRIGSQSALKPGDLVLFYDDLHHIGLFAGNGQVLHAPKPGAAVRYESINNMPFMFGVRV